MDLPEIKRLERERLAADNRRKAPALAALVDELREQFPGARVTWGCDFTTGHVVGERDENENAFTIPPNYHPTRAVETKRGKRA